jgi:hypothetical protein
MTRLRRQKYQAYGIMIRRSQRRLFQHHRPEADSTQRSTSAVHTQQALTPLCNHPIQLRVDRAVEAADAGLMNEQRDRGMMRRVCVAIIAILTSGVCFAEPLRCQLPATGVLISDRWEPLYEGWLTQVTISSFHHGGETATSVTCARLEGAVRLKTNKTCRFLPDLGSIEIKFRGPESETTVCHLPPGAGASYNDRACAIECQ